MPTIFLHNFNEYDDVEVPWDDIDWMEIEITSFKLSVVNVQRITVDRAVATHKAYDVYTSNSGRFVFE